MIYNLEYGQINERHGILNFLKDNKFDSVLDVGASYNMWAGDYVTHTLDLNKTDDRYKKFVGNMSDTPVWEEVDLYLKEHNFTFDFTICTHTLEDILNPIFVIKNMIKFSKGGFISMPSKWADLTLSTYRPWKGWMHHRWLFDVIDDTLVCVPKLPYFEYIDTTHFANKPTEIRFYWKDTFSVKFLNDDFIGPSEESYLEQVYQFLNVNS